MMLGDRAVRLSTGRLVRLVHPQIPFVPHYRVLESPGAHGPAPEEIGELMGLAHRLGETLALATFGDRGCFCVLLNASRVRRRPWFHIHLILARSPREKWWVLFALSQKRRLRRWARIVGWLVPGLRLRTECSSRSRGRLRSADRA